MSRERQASHEAGHETAHPLDQSEAVNDLPPSIQLRAQRLGPGDGEGLKMLLRRYPELTIEILRVVARSMGNAAVTRVVDEMKKAQAGAASAAAGPPTSEHRSLAQLETELGNGQALDGHESKLARSVGADPADIRVHRGPSATQAAAKHGAVAFATGNHVVMGNSAPTDGTPEGDKLMLHEAAHVAQQQDAARDPVQRVKPIGTEDPAAERDADRAATAGLGALASPANAIGGVRKTGLQLQRSMFPQEAPKNIATRSLGEKAALVKKSVADADTGWGRVVVDVFEQTDPTERIILQRQLDMAKLVAAMPDFEATRLGTLGPLTAGQAILNKKRAAYIEQVVTDFGDRAEVFVLFAFRGVYDDDAYTIFEELANRRCLHKVRAMPEVAKQIHARGLKTDGFNEPGPGVLGGIGEVAGGAGTAIKRMVKDDRPGTYGWQKGQLPPEYADVLAQLDMDDAIGSLTLANMAVGAFDQVTFGVPHGIVDLGHSTVNAIMDIASGDYRAAGEHLAGAAVVLLTHLGVKAWRVIRAVGPRTPAGNGARPVDNTPGLKGPEGPGQFVIPSFEGPITAEEARLGAIFELNPEAQAAMGRLIARIGQAGVEKVAGLVEANSRAALFVAEHGEPGVYAILEADGDVTAAGTRLPKRQLAAETTASSATKTLETSYQFVEITDVNGSPIGEFDTVVHDGVATDRFIEDKSARGLKHPKNRKTPGEWARRQIFEKTNTRIQNVRDAVGSRPRPDGLGSSSVPTLDQLRTIREFEFVIESADPDVQVAVEAELANLRAQHPGVRFTARFGK